MIRFVLPLLLAFSALPVSTAEAIERPRLDVVGFSPDGRFFAFRQSGVEEGSHTAFADLFVIDTKEDRWVQGTPLRVRAMEGQNNLSHVRQLLDDQSGRLMRRLGLNRAQEGVTFVPKAQEAMSIDLSRGEKIDLRIAPRSDIAALGCPVTMPVAKGGLQGFTLLAQRKDAITVLHHDANIPRARGCAQSYRFASGFVKSRGSDAVIAAMIAYKEVLQDGSVRVRYMAATGILPL